LVAYVVDVVRGRLVPARVEAADARAQVRALVVRERTVGQVDAVVDGVNALNELEVQLQPEDFDLFVVLGQTEDGSDNLLAKVLVHQASRRELGLGEASLAKHLGEPALVVVVPVLGGVVHAPDVDDNVERLNCESVSAEQSRFGGVTHASRGHGYERGLA